MIPRNLIALAWLLVALPAAAQTLTGAATDARGYKLYLYFSWYGPGQTNGTFNLGWPSNNVPIPGGPKVVMTSAKPGFEFQGSAVMPVSHYQETYGGERIRWPYPLHEFPEAEPAGDGIRVTVSLTDYVMLEDTNLVVTVAAGLYSHGGTNSGAGTIAVTNLSTVSYTNALAVANWSRATSWNRWTNSTQRLYAVGGAGQRPWPPRPSTLFRPLAGMAFIASDLYGNRVTSTVPDMTVDRSLQEIIPTARYQADLDMSGMSNRSPIRVDFVAWPHVGIAASVLDTRQDRWTGITGLPTSITNLWDPLQEYSKAWAIVHPSGSDTTGTVTTPANALTHTNYFLTTAKAAQAVRTNNAASAVWPHDDVGGGIISICDGITNWLGGTQSYGTNPLAHVRIINHPGHSPTYTTVSGNQDISDRIQIEGVNLGGGGNLFSSINYLTLRNCTIDSTNTLALFATCPVTWLIDCAVPRLNNGLRPYSTQNTRFHLDGCNLDGFSGSLNPGTMIGSRHSMRAGASPFILQQDTSSGQQASTEFTIWYNNEIVGLQQTSLAFWIGQNLSITNGVWIAQNTFVISTNHNSAVYNIGGSSLAHWNLILWFNSWLGKRIAGLLYRDTGVVTTLIELVSIIGNLFENAGMKTDTFGTPDGSRTGNWPVMWGVGFKGNVHINANTTGVEAPGSFTPEFFGLLGYHPMNVTNLVDWPQFVDARSVGYASVEGAGDFRLKSTSPIHGLFGMPIDIPLPYDLEGLPRGLWDPPGPYRSGNPRRSIAPTP